MVSVPGLSIRMIEPLAGTLVKYSDNKLALFESGDLSSKSVVIFIGQVPYTNTRVR